MTSKAAKHPFYATADAVRPTSRDGGAALGSLRWFDSAQHSSILHMESAIGF